MIDPLLLPVLSALGGVALAQGVAMLQSWLERENKRQILLRTKYEELAIHFLTSLKLPQDLMMARSTEAILETTLQTSGNQVHMLALVYFPLLQEATGQYIESYSSLCRTSAALYNSSDKLLLGEQIGRKPEYIAARNAYLSARNNLQDRIQQHAQKYARS